MERRILNFQLKMQNTWGHLIHTTFQHHGKYKNLPPVQIHRMKLIRLQNPELINFFHEQKKYAEKNQACSGQVLAPLENIQTQINPSSSNASCTNWNYISMEFRVIPRRIHDYSQENWSTFNTKYWATFF